MLSRLPLALLLSLSALAGSAAAQTTHTVNLNAFSFSPANLTIDLGDTVRWTWVTGSHNVVSGTNGVPDGAFSSGTPTFPPKTFSVTFNQGFLTSNPRSCHRYDYFCSVHVAFGMVGSVTVRIPASGTPRNGTGVNPAGYVQVSPPVLGGTWSTMVDIATPGAIASIVAVSPAPPIQVNTGIGQVLIDPSVLAAPLHVATGVHNVSIPGDCNLMGLRLATQAATFKPGAIQLQNAIDVVLGA